MMTTKKETIGQRIQRLRIGYAMTVEELAKKATLSVARLKLLESDEQEPNLAALFELAEAFGIEIDEVLPAHIAEEWARKINSRWVDDLMAQWEREGLVESREDFFGNKVYRGTPKISECQEPPVAPPHIPQSGV
jgi:transcriptional regulator with XRE-family HTH domain